MTRATSRARCTTSTAVWKCSGGTINVPLTGRVAIVTGGAGGIGAAVTRAFVNDGASVAISGLASDRVTAAGIAQELGPERCRFYESDVSDHKACAALAADVIKDFGHLDILVNNAGITRDRTIRNLAVEEWLDVIRVNLNGPFFMIKAVLDHMVTRGYGRIVNVSSVIALSGNIGQANYAAAKAGLLGLTKSLALETAGRGVTANCVAPGFIATSMVTAMPPQALEAGIGRTPVRRLGTPEEVARAIRFLVDENAGYVTGAVINVNGGLYMQ